MAATIHPSQGEGKEQVFSTSFQLDSREMLVDRLVLTYLRTKNQRLITTRGQRFVTYANDFVGQQIELKGVYEKDEVSAILDFAEAFDEEIFNFQAIDVGANVGNHTLQFSKRFKFVHAFEADPHTLELLNFNAKFSPNIQVHPFGLSDVVEVLNVREVPTNWGATSLCDNKFQGNAMQVEVLPGDKVLESKERVGFIKIDVEGMELQVLRGLERTIRSNRPVIMFEQGKEQFGDGYTRTPSIDYLSSLGYEIHWLETDVDRESRLFRGIKLVVRAILKLRSARTIKIVTGQKIPVRHHLALIGVPKPA